MFVKIEENYGFVPQFLQELWNGYEGKVIPKSYVMGTGNWDTRVVGSFDRMEERQSEFCSKVMRVSYYSLYPMDFFFFAIL